MFSATFKLLNVFGLELPANLPPIQEMQLSQLWHGIVGLVMMFAGLVLSVIPTGGGPALGTGGAAVVFEAWRKPNGSRSPRRTCRALRSHSEHPSRSFSIEMGRLDTFG